MIVTKTVASSSDEAFEVQVLPYQNLEGLERIYQENEVDKSRIVYDGRPKFMSEQLAIEVVESDNSHILKKLEIPKQNASYMTDLEDPKPQFKNYITGEFTEKTAKESFGTIVDKMYNTKFVFIHLKRISLDSPEGTP
ncbi:MAG: hypothetical protein P8J32_08410 [bacterium]|nr:hypothetical protein [bacterium]